MEPNIDHRNGRRSISNCFGLTNYRDVETRGYILLGGARGCAVITGIVYTTLAIDTLAERFQDCDGRVNLGLISPRASQVVPLAVTIEALCTAIISPLFGAYSDLSSKRRGLYIFTQSVWALMSAVQVVLLLFSSSDLIIPLLLAALVAHEIFYELSSVLHFSFLIDIGRGEDDLVIAIAAKYYTLLNGFQFLCIILVSLIATVFALSTLATAQIAGVFTVVTCALFSTIGLRRIRPRPAAHIQCNYSNAFSRGIFRLFKTMQVAFESYPQVLIFLIGYMSLISTVATLISLLPIYFRTQLGISPSIIGYIVLVSLLTTIPGSGIQNILKTKVSHKTLLIMIACFWCVAFALTGVILKGRPMSDEKLLEYESERLELDGGIPARCNTTISFLLEDSLVPRKRTSSSKELIISFIFAVVSGLGLGVTFPALASVYSFIIPGGQEAEFFGLRTFLFKVGSFLPPFIFYHVVETEGLDTACLWLIPLLVFALFMFVLFQEEKALEDIKHTIHLRHGAPAAREFLFGDPNFGEAGLGMEQKEEDNNIEMEIKEEEVHHEEALALA